MRYWGFFPAFVGFSALVGCTTLPEGWKKGDVIAIGTLEDQTDEPTEYDANDMLGHGWFDAKFRITRVMKGKLDEEVVAVRYFDHTFLRGQGYEHRLRLRPNEDGEGYIVCKTDKRRPGFVCR